MVFFGLMVNECPTHLQKKLLKQNVDDQNLANHGFLNSWSNVLAIRQEVHETIKHYP
jgi:hypothetical protein